MAISIKPEGKEMVFGAAWFTAKMETDLDTKQREQRPQINSDKDRNYIQRRMIQQ